MTRGERHGHPVIDTGTAFGGNAAVLDVTAESGSPSPARAPDHKDAEVDGRLKCRMETQDAVNEYRAFGVVRVSAV